ncbi:monothiol glutaredoxin-S5-like [Dioscorea cayenensis subsp. rotundata]|uniref:Monothiol glutaredoxin-S5-like n=2 Tax=Dioscorea cayennensis subsp. rotundata TaxID=55577 RepID=A0AB40AK87_DIOCR|nr:monothiol glutaredoxin-S5-like [Dioscorea cayenensis subsp. rotundata]
MEQLLMVAIKEEGLIPIVERSMVVIVGRRGCHMNYAAQRLLEKLKAYPTMHEVSEEFVVRMTFMRILGRTLRGDDKILAAPLFPVIFIGGKLVGGLDRLIAIHVTGKLIPMLKEAGAIWL